MSCWLLVKSQAMVLKLVIFGLISRQLSSLLKLNKYCDIIKGDVIPCLTPLFISNASRKFKKKN